MSEEKKDEVGFLVNIQKQSMLSGEVISVSTNLPIGSTSEDIRKTIELITTAIDWRIPPMSLDSMEKLATKPEMEN